MYRSTIWFTGIVGLPSSSKPWLRWPSESGTTSVSAAEIATGSLTTRSCSWLSR